MGKKKPVAKQLKPKVIPVRMDATFFFERAVQSLDRHHYDKALKYFRRAAEYEPENPVNHCNLAGILSEVGDYEESNQILRNIIDDVDPTMTECYFYMANNFANMEDYESAEKAIVHYLEKDPNGQFLEESEEMIELLSYELEHTPQLNSIKSRTEFFEHDKARMMLEEGKFVEAVRILEKLIKKHPNFLAARNNLALAYYYKGYIEKALAAIQQVLELDYGNLHALCNLAIFYQHLGEREKLAVLMEQLRKTYPFHQEHVFKLATTMGILGEHETAFRLFKRLLRSGEAGYDPCLYHYNAVAAYNTNRYAEAEKLWKTAEKLDPKSDIPKFYLSQMKVAGIQRGKLSLSYHYHLPFEEQFRMLEKSNEGIPEKTRRDPLVRSSFFWALRYGDRGTKLQVIQALGMIADKEVEEALKEFVQVKDEDDYLKRVALFVLRNMGITDPLTVMLNKKKTVVHTQMIPPNLPVWEQKWQNVMDTALGKMSKRYDIVQQHDLETLWVEFLTRVYPEVPRIHKVEGWSAALEYLTAKMHRREISYKEISERYGTSITTISKNAKLIDQACGLREKMNAIFPKFANLEKQ